MKLVSVHEYAKLVGKSRQEIYRLAREGRIKSKKVEKIVVRILVEIE